MKTTEWVWIFKIDICLTYVCDVTPVMRNLNKKNTIYNLAEKYVIDRLFKYYMPSNNKRIQDKIKYM